VVDTVGFVVVVVVVAVVVVVVVEEFVRLHKKISRSSRDEANLKVK
jgi:uncharacterized membrane protein YcjF (UPF0283 family)